MLCKSTAFSETNQIATRIKYLPTQPSDDYQGKVVKMFCIIDEFDKNLNIELSKNFIMKVFELRK